MVTSDRRPSAPIKEKRESQVKHCLFDMSLHNPRPAIISFWIALMLNGNAWTQESVHEGDVKASRIPTRRWLKSLPVSFVVSGTVGRLTNREPTFILAN